MLRRSELVQQRGVHAARSGARLVVPSAQQRPWQRRALTVATASSVPESDPSRGILEAFYYGKAAATVLNRKLGDLVVALLSDVSRVAADVPQQLQAFQDEVQAMVQEELGSSATPISGGGGGSSGGSSGAKPGGGALPTGASGDGIKGYNTAPTDLQALVDELRADIAASRAVLQQLKSQP